MKIDGSGRIEAMRAYDGVRGKYTEHVSGQGKNNQGDTLEISAEAQKIQFYLKELNNISDVRDPLVNSLKKRIEEGTYTPDLLRIAEAVLQDMKNNQAGSF